MMNIRTLLFTGSLCLLTISPLQAGNESAPAPVVLETAKTTKKQVSEKIAVTPKAETDKPAATQAEPAQLDSRVNMSVGTIIVILLLIIILL